MKRYFIRENYAIKYFEQSFSFFVFVLLYYISSIIRQVYDFFDRQDISGSFNNKNHHHFRQIYFHNEARSAVEIFSDLIVR